MHAPCSTWSESLEIETFAGWAESFFHSDMSDGLEFMEGPMDRFDEFVTAAPLNPGQNPLLKPDKACSGRTPLTPDLQIREAGPAHRSCEAGKGGGEVKYSGHSPRF